jgi:hypothetical protein
MTMMRMGSTFRTKAKPEGVAKVFLKTRGIVRGQKNGNDWENFRGSIQLPDGSSISITITSRNDSFIQKSTYKGVERDGIWCQVAHFKKSMR